MAIQSGKKPLSSKQKSSAPITLEDLFGNVLSISPELEKELAEKGLAYRYISAPELQKFGGNHRYGWRPYQKSKSDTMLGETSFGSDPSGYVRRGELILAVRPLEVHNKHKAYLKQEAARAASIQQTKAGEIRDMVRGASGIKVHEGYEDDGEESVE